MPSRRSRERASHIRGIAYTRLPAYHDDAQRASGAAVTPTHVIRTGDDGPGPARADYHDMESEMRSLVLSAAILMVMASGAYGQSYTMTIHLRSGQTVPVPIDSISRMSFSKLTGFQSEGTSVYAPTAFRLLQNYPNPFNPSTTIAYETAGTADVRVRVFDTRGALVRDLLHEAQASGLHRVVWDGTDNARVHVASGVYIAVVQCAGQLLSRTMILMK